MAVKYMQIYCWDQVARTALRKFPTIDGIQNQNPRIVCENLGCCLCIWRNSDLLSYSHHLSPLKSESCAIYPDFELFFLCIYSYKEKSRNCNQVQARAFRWYKINGLKGLVLSFLTWRCWSCIARYVGQHSYPTFCKYKRKHEDYNLDHGRIIQL